MRTQSPPRPSIDPHQLMPDVAHAQDGVFTRAQARAEGLYDAEQRRLLRTGAWLRLVGRVLHPAGLEIGPWQRARAVHLLGRTVSHGTAGALWGFSVDDTALHGIRSHGTRVAGLADHRPDVRREDVVTVAGMRVTAPLRSLVDLLATMPEDLAVALVTDALRRRVITTADLDAAARAARRRTGVNQVRGIADSCSGEPWSWLEWRFQAAARSLGPGWRFNVRIEAGTGSALIVDAIHGPSGTIVELDGRQFHGDDRFQADRTRDQRLAAAGYVVVRITWEDLNERFDLVMSRLAQTIAARMHPRRSA